MTDLSPSVYQLCRSKGPGDLGLELKAENLRFQAATWLMVRLCGQWHWQSSTIRNCAEMKRGEALALSDYPEMCCGAMGLLPRCPGFGFQQVD